MESFIDRFPTEEYLFLGLRRSQVQFIPSSLISSRYFGDELWPEWLI